MLKQSLNSMKQPMTGDPKIHSRPYQRHPVDRLRHAGRHPGLGHRRHGLGHSSSNGTAGKS